MRAPRLQELRRPELSSPAFRARASFSSEVGARGHGIPRLLVPYSLLPIALRARVLRHQDYPKPMHNYQPTVLLVLASDGLRNRAYKELALAGYNVLVADRGVAAMAYLQEAEVPPDLVVVDTGLRDVPPSTLASESSKRGARVLPVASHRFAAGNPDPRAGFSIAALLARIASALGSRALHPAVPAAAFQPAVFGAAVRVVRRPVAL